MIKKITTSIRYESDNCFKSIYLKVKKAELKRQRNYYIFDLLLDHVFWGLFIWR